jgi:hypothetical protein
MYYLIPATGLLGVTIAITMWQIKQWHCSIAFVSRTLAYGTGAVFVAMSLCRFMPLMQPFHTGLAKRQINALAFSSKASSLATNMSVVYGKYVRLPVPALHFGNCTARSAQSKPLFELYPSSYVYTKHANLPGHYQNWFTGLPFYEIWKRNTNICLIVESGFPLGKPEEPVTFIHEQNGYSIYAIVTNIDAASSEQAVTVVAPQTESLAGGHALAQLKSWMEAWSWQVNDYESQAGHLASILTNAGRTSNEWQELVDQARDHRLLGAEPLASLGGYAASNDIERIRHMLAVLSAATNRFSWPLYAAAMHFSPSNVTRNYVVLWPELWQRGLDASEFSDHQLLWFQYYYQRFCGWQRAIDYWDWIRKLRPTYAGAATVNQALLEFAHGNRTNVVARLANDWDLVISEPWMIDRADQMLQRIQTPEAQQLLQQIIAIKNRRGK